MCRRLIVLVIALVFFPLAGYDLGQRFIFSLPENISHKNLQRWLHKTKPAGVMLLSSHCTNRAQLRQTITFLQEEAQKLGMPPLLVAIDWEGGIVSRPNEAGGFHTIPSPWLLAQAGRSSCFLAGALIGHQMRDVGINVDFAPSLDLFDQANQILATRCFSADPDETAECGTAFAKGLMQQSIVPVIKHFPGLGRGGKDTHCIAVTIDVSDKQRIRQTKPFELLLGAGILCVMVTHAIVPSIDTVPLTLSSKLVQQFSQQHPEVLLITDDFCMKAVSGSKMTVAQAAFQSLNAGYHLLIFSGKTQDQYKLLTDLTALCDKQSLTDVEKKYQAIASFKCKHLTNRPAQIVNEQYLAAYLADRCLLKGEIFPSLADKKVVMVTVDLPKIRPPETWFLGDHGSLLKNLLASKNINVYEIIVDPRQSTPELADSIARHAGDPQTLFVLQTFFYADNVWNSVQQEWLEMLKPFQDKTIVVSLGHPYEQTVLPDASVLTLGSFHQPLLTSAASYLADRSFMTGADQFVTQLPTYLSNKRFGLVCNQCSVVRSGQENVFLPDLLYEWAGKQHNHTKLAALFCPEHGLLGGQSAGARVASQHQTAWQCPLYSLHGATKKPSPESLKDLDALIIDLQDVGMRCFTYVSTLKHVIEAAAAVHLPVIVLDHYNPLQQWGAAGPLLEKEYESFVGCLPVPLLYGSTIGALAQTIAARTGAQLTVLPCQQLSDAASVHLPRPPSPNLMSIDHIYAYPLTVFFEGTNYSEGRGTAYPFIQIGAPWVDENKLACYLNKQKLPGVYFEPITFTPHHKSGVADHPKHENALCHGVYVHLLDQKVLQPIQTAQALLESLFTLYPRSSKVTACGKKHMLDLLVGNDLWRKKLERIQKVATSYKARKRLPKKELSSDACATRRDF